MWYKDTYAARGSQLRKALEDKDEKLARSLYNEAEKVFVETYGKWVKDENGVLKRVSQEQSQSSKATRAQQEATSAGSGEVGAKS